MEKKTEILIEGLTFTEGPRWREDRLFFSDFFTKRVLSVDLQGNVETIVETPVNLTSKQKELLKEFVSSGGTKGPQTDSFTEKLKRFWKQ